MSESAEDADLGKKINESTADESKEGNETPFQTAAADLGKKINESTADESKEGTLSKETPFQTAAADLDKRINESAAEESKEGTETPFQAAAAYGPEVVSSEDAEPEASARQSRSRSILARPLVERFGTRKHTISTPSLARNSEEVR